MPLDPRDAFARVMGASMEDFEMPKTNAILDLLNLLGIPLADARPIAALPINVVPTKPMTPGSNLLEEDLDMEQIL